MGEKPDYQKYADRTTRERAYDESIGRLRMGLFVALLGVLALGVTWVLKYPVAKGTWLAYGILGTAPVGALLAIVNYLRVPGTGKVTGKAIGLLVFTFILAASTVSVARYLGLF